MAIYFNSPAVYQRFYDNNGLPLANGRLYFYVAGSNIPKNVFHDPQLTDPYTSPMILDSNGVAPEYFMKSGLYKVVIKDKNDVLIATRDYIVPCGSDEGRIDLDDVAFKSPPNTFLSLNTFNGGVKANEIETQDITVTEDFIFDSDVGKFMFPNLVSGFLYWDAGIGNTYTISTNDMPYVRLTGNQSIDGEKTFNDTTKIYTLSGTNLINTDYLNIRYGQAPRSVMQMFDNGVIIDAEQYVDIYAPELRTNNLIVNQYSDLYLKKFDTNVNGTQFLAVDTMTGIVTSATLNTANLVTTNTAQTITGQKTFNPTAGGTIFGGEIRIIDGTPALFNRWVNFGGTVTSKAVTLHSNIVPHEWSFDQNNQKSTLRTSDVNVYASLIAPYFSISSPVGTIPNPNTSIFDMQDSGGNGWKILDSDVKLFSKELWIYDAGGTPNRIIDQNRVVYSTELRTNTLRASGSSGIAVKNSSGNNIVVMGASTSTSAAFVNDVQAKSFSLISTSSTPVGKAQFGWNDIDKTIDIGMENGVVLQAGQEFLVYGRNETGSIIPNGTAVILTSAGTSDGSLRFALASNNNQTAHNTIAVTTQQIGVGAFGYATKYGKVRGLNTAGYIEGTKVYLGVNGTITNVQPSFPSHSVELGYTTTAHATSGAIYVVVKTNDALEDLYNVNITAPTMGDSLIYENNRWINRNFGAITKESTGFKDPELVDIVYNPATRTVTLGGTVEAYYRSNIVPALSAGYVSSAHPAGATSTQFLLYDGTSIKWQSTPWTYDQIQIAAVVYDSDGTYIATIRESHGTMQWQTHREFHETIGTYLTQGGDITNFVVNSTTAANRRPDISTSVLNDEDLRTTVSALTSKSYNRFNLSGTGSMVFTSGNAEIISVTGGTPNWNQFTGGAWTQTAFSNNQYGAIFVVAIPAANDAISQDKRYFFVQPQSVSTTLATIQALTPNNVNLGNFANLNPEICFIGKIIVQASAGNWVIVSVEKLTGTKISQTSTTGNFLSVVETAFPLSGNGTVGSPVSLAVSYMPTSGGTFTGNIFATNLAGTNTGDETKATIEAKLTGNITSHTHSYLATVSVDSTLAGNGNPGSPLGIAECDFGTF